MKILFKVFNFFSKTERLIFTGAAVVFAIASIFLILNFVDANTVLQPVKGGEYIEGEVGQVSFVNPILVGSNDADRDLTGILFSNLLDLAEKYKVDNTGKIWDVRLKDGLFWDDGSPITSDDVIFTIKTIQDPDSRSPLFATWQGISVERVSEREFKFILPETYVFFENTLEELRPIPQHIFKDVPAANVRLSDYNLEPVGNGPFKFSSLKKERSGFISEYQLVRNEKYFGQAPYLDKLTFKFFQNEDDMIKSFNAGTIFGFGGINEKSLSNIGISHEVFEMKMPRYYAIFFNPYSRSALKDKNVRLALTYATDKKGLIEKVFDNRAIPVDGPLVPGMEGYAPEVYPGDSFSLEKANSVLNDGGWTLNSDGVRGKTMDKSMEQLQFTLVVPQTEPLIQAANKIRDDWAQIGVKLNLDFRSADDIVNNIIKDRNYEMLLFGNIFDSSDNPDLFSFWDSSERFYPGLNLALYESKTADNLIESIRANLVDQKRQSDLSSLQSLIIGDSPAVFLFSPDYLYVTKGWLNGFGVDSKMISFAADRFNNIENWYVKTARVFK